MNQILNISCYKFVALPDAEDLRQPCLDQALARGLKGTILIAEEGINFFLAGPAAEVHAFVDWLRQDPRFSDLMPKESWSAAQPFRKMLVKVKREIIRKGCTRTARSQPWAMSSSNETALSITLAWPSTKSVTLFSMTTASTSARRWRSLKYQRTTSSGCS